MVSSRAFSAESRTTGPHGAVPPSGQGAPVENRAAASRSSQLFPSPGSPARTTSFPRGHRCGRTHSTARGVTVSSATSTGASPAGRLEAIGSGDGAAAPRVQGRAASSTFWNAARNAFGSRLWRSLGYLRPSGMVMTRMAMAIPKLAMRSARPFTKLAPALSGSWTM